MATSTLANSPDPLSPLIDSLTEMVKKAEQPKPPQSEPDGFRIPDSIPTDEERRIRNAAMLLGLWKLGETLVKPTLQDALHGFPDVNSYYADAAGR
jgi:hypothetical protein